MTFYNRSVAASKAGGSAIEQLGYHVTLEDLFSTGKAYAGNEYAESDTYADRVAIFTKYYADTIVEAETMSSPEKMFEGIFLNNDKVSSVRPDIGLNGEQMVKNMLANNQLRGVGEMLANAQNLRSLFDAALLGGPKSKELKNYIETLTSLIGTGAFKADGRYDGFLSQNNTDLINEQKRYVATNRDLYEGGIRIQVEGGYLNYYERDGKYYQTGIVFDVVNGRIEPLRLNNNSVEISREEYERVVNTKNGVYRDEVLAKINEAAKRGEYYKLLQLSKELEDAKNEMERYELATYCNVNTAGFSVNVGAINVQYDGRRQYSANDGNTRLRNGLFNEDGGYLQVTEEYAKKIASFGLFGFASSYGNPSGHHSPFVYSNGTLSFMNVGGTFDMNATQDDAFGSSRDIDYWIWLKW